MIDQVLNSIPSDQPVWVYALVALIPFCMMLALREFVCWFWKLNALVSRLDRIEKSVLKVERAIKVEADNTASSVNRNNKGPDKRTPQVVLTDESTSASGEFKLE
jgi:hypothetical protein